MPMKTILDCSVSVLCPDCEDGIVNPDQRIVLKAHHPGYSEVDLSYEWELYRVADGSQVADRVKVT